MKPPPRWVYLQLVGDSRPLVKLGSCEDLDIPWHVPGGLDLLERLFLIPEARALVVLNKDSNGVRIRRADLDEVLSRIDADYLVVTSRPPQAVPGKTFTYKPTVKAKRDKLKFSFEIAPEGMKVAPDGTITWDVPRDWTGPTAVTLVVGDTTRQEFAHTFTVVQAPPGSDGGQAVAVQAGPNPNANSRIVPVNRSRFSFPPVSPLEIKAAPLDQDKVEVKLPGKVFDAVAGGGGRYWCLHLADQRQVAILDVNEAKITKSIPLASGNAIVAAGMNKLFVVYPDVGIVVRYDLATAQKEVAAKLPFDGSVTHMVMGSASSGPLLIRYVVAERQNTKAVVFLDGTDFKLLETGYNPLGYPAPGYGNTWYYRAAPDGRHFTSWTIDVTARTREIFTIDDSGIRLSGGEGGTLLHSDGGVLLSPTTVSATGTARVVAPQGEFIRIPSQSGPFYLAKSSSRTQPNPNGPLELYGYWSARPIAALRSLTLAGGYPTSVSANFGPDLLHFFCPNAGILAVLAPSSDKIILQKLALDATLGKSDVNYLFVNSRPPAAEVGQPFRYPVAVKSKAGGVAFKLDAAPEGMTVSPDGVINWTVPQDWAEPVGVSLRVTDKSGAEVLHSFVLAPYVPGAIAARPPATVPPFTPVPPQPGNPPGGPKVDVVRPAVNPAKITPTKVTASIELKLPNPADATCLGGNGRYVIYRVPKSKVAVILDVCEGKFVKSVPIQEDGTLIAAGNEHLYLVSPKANAIVRWNLTTLQKEGTYPNPYDTEPHGAFIGHASDGPLLLIGPGKGGDPGFVINASPQPPIRVGKGGIGLVDGKTGKAIEWPAGGPGNLATVAWYRGGMPLRGSANGRVYGHHWEFEGSKVAVFGPTGLSSFTPAIGTPVLPGSDGTLFTNRGLFALDGKPVVPFWMLANLGGPNARGRHSVMPLPPAHGRAYLTFDIDDDRGVGRSTPDKTSVYLRVLGEERPITQVDRLATLVHLPEQSWTIGSLARGNVSLSDCVTLVPDAKALVILDKTYSKVIVEKFDLDELLAKAKFDYLLVTSQPPDAVRGRPFTYKPAVMTKQGAVKLTLDGGPPGMKLANGTLTWNVPADFAQQSVFVILTIADSAGQEILYTFTLPIRDDPAKP
jgi:hypothetical protein